MPKNDLALFEWKRIRRVWDEKKEMRYFSLIDIISILIEQEDYKKAKSYRTTLKWRLKAEWSEVVTNCDQLKIMAADGKFYMTDVANTEIILRLVQSIPSKKAEPIKLWLAKVGYERMQETIDPARSIDRARQNRKTHGRSEKWIQQRMMWQETRNKLTDYRRDRDIKEGEEFAILTNIIHQEWTGLSVKDHKKLKQLKSQNLRDHMSEAELIFTALAELSTRSIAETTQAKWLDENKLPAKKWWQIAKNAKNELESKIWKNIITWENYLPTKHS